MSKNLVIVESPGKVKAIEKILGPDFKVMSSHGHIRDLKKHALSIDLDNGFKPEYEVAPEKKRLVADLKKAVGEAKVVWLASDEDREGEAIAWHLAEVLDLDPLTTRRIVFHEITEEAILNAIENPRHIDLNMVDAQQARRVLDRIVGFELSPVLWRKVKPGLSAGRVQSVALRIICEREKEINNFKSEPFWRVNASLRAGDTPLRAELSRRLPDEASARALLESLRGGEFSVADIKVSPVKKSPQPPFTTSTLQQEASRRLGMSVSSIMRVAQSLYEAGHITYMRTDSLNLSDYAMHAIADEVTATFGKEYLKPRRYHTSSKGAQEAHEAIRPTYFTKRELPGVTEQEQRLYKLIYRRAMASQMADAKLERTVVDINVAPATVAATKAPSETATFKAEGEVVTFDGFLRVYMDNDAPLSNDEENMLPRMTVGQTLTADEVTATERFTQQPPRYTEGALVKKLEELGIGRPSTYTPTISTIQQREYVARGERPGQPRKYGRLTLSAATGDIAAETLEENTGSDKGKLVPTDVGIIVNDYLTDHFPDVLDYEFTARAEQLFDSVAKGKNKWDKEIGEFYDKFHPEVTTASNDKEGLKPGERYLGPDPATGKPVSVKIGRYGAMVQIGDAADADKPRFASLRPDQSVFEITLDEALKLFELPRSLGADPADGKEVKAAIGRFGPYVSHAGLFASIPKDMSALTITLDEALALLAAKREAEAKKLVKSFDDDPDLHILNGRYGIYICYKKANYKIPKTVADPAALTLEECRDIIASQPAPKPRARRAAPKAAAPKPSASRKKK